MTQLTQEEVRDEILSLYEEKEESLQKFSSEIEKIENEGIEFFERKVIAIKNKLVQDQSIADENLEAKYLEEVELARKESLQRVEEKISALVQGVESN
jgi:hypothetical protein